MPISDWPAAERPREKLVARGPGALSDAELLAILLRSGRRGCSALDLARDLLGRFGGLRELLEQERTALCAVPGLGDASYAQLAAALELARRHLEAGLCRGDVLTSPELTRAFLASRLRHRDREVFLGLFLDNRHRLLAAEELFVGTLHAATVHPREVARRALGLNAAALIVAHNHPSGSAEPSAADIALTRRLREALELVDVRLLDHFVVGDGSPVSLAERGEL